MKNKNLIAFVKSGFMLNAFAYTAPDTRTDTLTAVQRTVYSKEVEFKALPNMRFFQFAQQKTELGVEPGLTVAMLTYDNLKVGGKLKENEALKTQAMSGSQKTITVTEYGNAVSVSEKLFRTSFDDVMAEATTLLGRDYALVLDMELRDAALSATNVVYAAKGNGTKNTARTGLDDTSTLKVSTIKDSLEILASANAPKWGGAYWICFVHPHQSRTLRDDPAWISAAQYGDPERLFTGEIGRIDDVRFIETTLMTNGAAAADDFGYDKDLKKGNTPTGGGTPNTINVFRAVIFGDNFYGVAFSLPVEIRDNGTEDFGRKRSLAWYSIFGVAKLHDQYGVMIESA